jgi:putative membrane protein
VHLIIGTVLGRWYVTLFGAVFLWRAARQMGWRKTLTYLAVSLVVGIAAENGSVHAGIPYTTYTFDHALRHKELFVGSVPLMVPLSYSFMAYFAFAAGRILASGPFRTRAPRRWHELLAAWMLAVWALFVLDPVSRLGGQFYLGELWRYRGSGFWFGLPLGSQIGFGVTAAVLLAVLHRLDGDAPDVAVPGGFRDHPHAIALVTYHGQVFHMAFMAFWVGADTIGGASLVIWFPVAVMTAISWSNLRIQRDATDANSSKKCADSRTLLRRVAKSDSR